MGCTQKVRTYWLPKDLIAEIPYLVEYFCAGGRVPSLCLISTQRTHIWSCIRFCFSTAVAQAAEAAGSGSLANSTGIWVSGFVFASGSFLHRAGEGLLGCRRLWKPFLRWQLKFMWFLIVCKQSLLKLALNLRGGQLASKGMLAELVWSLPFFS